MKTLEVKNNRRFFNAPTPRFGRGKNRLPLGRQESSPYYWWWQFLRRNASYIECCAAGGTGALADMYQDFGDVRSDDFHAWWTHNQRGAELFAEQPLSIRFGELVSRQDWQPNWSSEDVIVLAVPLTMSKRSLKGAFNDLLQRRHTGNKSGRTSRTELKESSTARFQLERNYTIQSLQTTLAVYDTWVQNKLLPAKERLTLWQIGKHHKLNRKALENAESSHSADRLIGRNLLGATVGRYVKNATAMIENTAKGKFPLV